MAVPRALAEGRMMNWTLFVFVGAYPWKSSMRKPTKQWVFVDCQNDEAIKKFEDEIGYEPRARGFVYVEAATKEHALTNAVWNGHIQWQPQHGGPAFGPDKAAMEQIFKDKRVLVIEQTPMPVNTAGEHCCKCKQFLSWVAPNNPDGTFTCGKCKQPTLAGTW